MTSAGLLELNLDGILLPPPASSTAPGVGAGASSNQGALFLSRVDVNPLGDFAFDETAGMNAHLRVGVGGGVAWNPYTSYDSAGYEDVNVSDFRGSLSARMAVAGISLSAEFLKRYQVDDLTHRPVEATGAYGQAGWLLEFGLEPIFRMGWVSEDQSFEPQQTAGSTRASTSTRALTATPRRRPLHPPVPLRGPDHRAGGRPRRLRPRASQVVIQ